MFNVSKECDSIYLKLHLNRGTCERSELSRGCGAESLLHRFFADPVPALVQITTSYDVSAAPIPCPPCLLDEQIAYLSFANNVSTACMTRV